jgi:hypothetical protein
VAILQSTATTPRRGHYLSASLITMGEIIMNQDRKDQSDKNHAANRDQHDKQEAQNQPRKNQQPQQTQDGREQNRQADSRKDRTAGQARQGDQTAIPLKDRSQSDSHQARR